MKRFIYTAVILVILAAGTIKTYGQANKTLSNLTSPTSINQSLLPNSTATKDIGSGSKSWNNIYANGGLFLGGSKFLSNAGSFNTFIGSDAGHAITSGTSNAALGFQALYFNTTGSANAALGTDALYNNTGGYNNTAVGNSALFSNTTGYHNTATGMGALFGNTTGFYNTANGVNSLFYNTTGSYNTATGASALQNNTTGGSNTASGDFSLFSNTTGISNTGTGIYALYYNTTGSDNTATGVDALVLNTTGYNNTSTGVDAMYENTTGAYNTATGMDAMFWNFTGNYNTAVGNYALNQTTSADFNACFGYFAGGGWDNGWNNTFLGANTGVPGPGYYNVVAVGQGTLCTAVSQARIGNSATTSIGGYANWTNISDVRVKKNIKQNVPGLAFINKLQPITYNLDLAAIDQITQSQRPKDKDGNEIKPNQQELDARKAKEQILYTGFAAQDVEKAAKSLNYDFSGVDAAKNDKDLYGLRYAEFVVPLVKAVQELSSQNDSLKNENETQKAINANLESRLAKLEATMNGSSINSTSQKSVALSSASIEQNIPNPFSTATTINYTLPQQYDAAKIVITDQNSRTLKEITLSGSGTESLNVDTSTLSAGTYQYSLFVNGKLIDTKQMVLIK